MGQNPSSINKGQRRSFRSFVRRSKLNKSNLSHTFSLPPSEEYSELMNINTATEEQLMTLPGVSRQLAREIVRHRRRIGRFKRVDDLALVSGIGAEKLEILRPEICTNNKRGLSRASSCTQSLDSVRVSTDSRLCSVNSASVFQLQCVPGLNQELAANIVDYRKKKGPFKSLDDLIKVRGMDIIRLSSVKPHLSLEPRKCESVQHLNGILANGFTSHQLNNSLSDGFSQPRTPHRKSLSMPTKLPIALSNGFATAPVNDILDLLSAYSHRPVAKEDFRYERDGEKCCRLASWNLHQLSVEKVTNPGVKEVISMTVLENKLSLIAIQDVLDELALRIICDELNSPTLRRVRQWKCNSKQWQYCLAEHYDSKKLGFIYEASNGFITIEDVSLERILLNDSENQRLIDEWSELANGGTNCSIWAQAFLICDKPLVIVNVACGAGGALAEAKRDELAAVLSEAGGRRVPVAVLGDFGASDNIKFFEEVGELLVGDIQTSTDLAVQSRSNIVTGKGVKAFNGFSGCVRVGLNHLAIPKGWSWGGPVSPHCPVWAEYVFE